MDNILHPIPTPPQNKSGWPWDTVPQPLPPTMPNGSPWPKMSIVTPSFNQAQYLEETIRSVLLQGYPNLEYIIIDGGSTDGSVEIIKKYEPWLTYWVSEKDRGQSHAINKGFDLATGSIAGWINSDDVYYPHAFEIVALWWVENEKPNDLITGTKLKGNSTLDSISRLNQEPFTTEHLLTQCIVEQPSTFFPLQIFKEIGGIDERYHLSLDYDLWLRFSHNGSKIRFIDRDLAITRVHSLAKTSKFQKQSCRESFTAVWRSYKLLSAPWIKKWITAVLAPSTVDNTIFKNQRLFIRNAVYKTIITFLQIVIFPIRLINHKNYIVNNG